METEEVTVKITEQSHYYDVPLPMDPHPDVQHLKNTISKKNIEIASLNEQNHILKNENKRLIQESIRLQLLVKEEPLDMPELPLLDHSPDHVKKQLTDIIDEQISKVHLMRGGRKGAVIEYLESLLGLLDAHRTTMTHHRLDSAVLTLFYPIVHQLNNCVATSATLLKSSGEKHVELDVDSVFRLSELNEDALKGDTDQLVSIVKELKRYAQDLEAQMNRWKAEKSKHHAQMEELEKSLKKEKKEKKHLKQQVEEMMQALGKMDKHTEKEKWLLTEHLRSQGDVSQQSKQELKQVRDSVDRLTVRLEQTEKENGQLKELLQKEKLHTRGKQEEWLQKYAVLNEESQQLTLTLQEYLNVLKDYERQYEAISSCVQQSQVISLSKREEHPFPFCADFVRLHTLHIQLHLKSQTMEESLNEFKKKAQEKDQSWHHFQKKNGKEEKKMEQELTEARKRIFDLERECRDAIEGKKVIEEKLKKVVSACRRLYG